MLSSWGVQVGGGWLHGDCVSSNVRDQSTAEWLALVNHRSGLNERRGAGSQPTKKKKWLVWNVIDANLRIYPTFLGRLRRRADVRVVKETDSKIASLSVGLCPRRFKSYFARSCNSFVSSHERGQTSLNYLQRKCVNT